MGFLSVLYSYFGESTVVQDIGTYSTLGTLLKACSVLLLFFFFFSQGGERFVTIIALHACLELVNRRGRCCFVIEWRNGFN